MMNEKKSVIFHRIVYLNQTFWVKIRDQSRKTTLYTKFKPNPLKNKANT